MEPEEFQKTFGRGVDIHKWIGKLPGPKAGFTPSNFKYMGPYNPVDQQLSCNLETGEVEWKVKPYNKMRLRLIVIFVTTWEKTKAIAIKK